PLATIWTENLYPGADSTYQVGDSGLAYSAGYFDDLYSGQLTLSDTNPLTLVGNGMVWLEFRPDLDYTTITAQGKPTWVTRGVFGGYSLPIYAADNEELFFELCVPDRWVGPAWADLGATGINPGSMAEYNDVLYIPCGGDDTIWYYDGTTLADTGAVVGDEPAFACIYGNNLYVSCRTDATIWMFDGTTWSKSGDVGSAPLGMEVYGGDLYVACENDDTVWVLSGGVWALDGNVGDQPRHLQEYGGDLYLSCAGADDDVWIKSGGVWAKDDDVDNGPQVFMEHDGDLYLTCEDSDTVWYKTGGVWAVVTNIQSVVGNAPIGMEEYAGDLYVACLDAVWSDLQGFWNENSEFSEVTADEPMFLREYNGSLYCTCYVGNEIWVYSGPTFYDHIHCWISAAQVNATDAFRLQLYSQHFTPGVGIVPNTSDEFTVETLTGVAAQYQTYSVYIPVDMTGATNDDSKVGRLIRIASSDEIAGEVVIQHVGLLFKCDKLGAPTP
ncbi:MAG: hypothetical protein PHV11_10125, partial [Candidatus Bipolaricaulis sp.]|nr:hypothetical protein [Candidatus Bipolaricaulis sp.]